MGGTEILSALEDVVRMRNSKKDMNTEIILLTDGEVWDTEKVISFVRETRAETKEKVRFFALGIGDAVSHQLIEGLGRQGGGFAEVVAVDGAGRWESRVIRMLKGALMPASWQFQISFPEVADTATFASGISAKESSDFLSQNLPIPRPHIVQAPFRTSFLHAFGRTSYFFFIDPQKANQILSLTIKATSPGGEQIEVQLPLEKVEAPPLTIHHLAAKALLNDLETGQSWMHSEQNQYCMRDLVAFENAVQHEAERIGIEWSITGKWTSFLAIDSSDEVEQTSRTYRAERSELVDLTRQKYGQRYAGKPGLVQFRGSSNRVMGDGKKNSMTLAPRLYKEVVSWRSRPVAAQPQNPRSSGDQLSSRSSPGKTPEDFLGHDVGDLEEPQGSKEDLSTTSDYNQGNLAMPQAVNAATKIGRGEYGYGPLLAEYDYTTGFGSSLSPPSAPISEMSPSILDCWSPVAPFAEATQTNTHIAASSKANDISTLHSLIDQQNTDGSFNMLSNELYKRVLACFSNDVMEQLERALASYDSSLRAKICISILTILFINDAYTDSADLWDLVDRKAKHWIKQQLNDPAEFEALTEMAKTNIQSSSQNNQISKQNGLSQNFDFVAQ